MEKKLKSFRIFTDIEIVMRHFIKIRLLAEKLLSFFLTWQYKRFIM